MKPKNGFDVGTSVNKGVAGNAKTSPEANPKRARMTNTAICARVTGSSGQYVVVVHPLVIPRSFIFWMYLKKGCVPGTSVNAGAAVNVKVSPSNARMMNTAIC